MEWFGKVVEALGAKRLWLFLAAAFATATLLFSPDVGPLAFSAVRIRYEVYLVIGFIVSIAVLVFGSASSALAWFRAAHGRNPRSKITPLVPQCLWGVHRQQDGTESSQFSAAVHFFNGSELHLQVVRVRLTWPLHGDDAVTTAVAFVAGQGGQANPDGFIPPGGTRRVSVNVLLKGRHGGRGKKTYARFALQDQTGRAHTFGLWLRDPQAAD
jgi:hypothetical protein